MTALRYALAAPFVVLTCILYTLALATAEIVSMILPAPARVVWPSDPRRVRTYRDEPPPAGSDSERDGWVAQWSQAFKMPTAEKE